MPIRASGRLQRRSTRLATERARAAQRSQRLSCACSLRARRGTMTVDDVNRSDRRIAIVDAVANLHAEIAVAATDRLIDFAASMFDVMELDIDRLLLDCGFERSDVS